MKFHLSLKPQSGFSTNHKRLGASLIALGLVATQATPAFATIDNTANASGSYGATTVTTPTGSTVNVPVQPALPTLTVVKSVATPVDTTGDGIFGAGDTITYSYLITNTGNVTINSVLPVDVGPKFNTISGTGSQGAFTHDGGLVTAVNLAPLGTKTFEMIYTMSAADAYNAAGLLAASTTAVENSATATGTPVTGTLGAVTASTAETQVPATPQLSITKSWAFEVGPAGDVDGDGNADLGDKVVYTYTVTNSGNVTVTGVTIADIHEGAALGAGLASNEALISDVFGTSTDAAVNASWDSLNGGGKIKFTYTHTVTQTEVDGG